MSQFLKLFPGDKDFKEVSEREWNAPYEPFKDQNGHGNILGLTADVRVWDRPGGKLVVAKKWPSRSFIRNFGRMMRSMFSGSDIPLVDYASLGFTPCLAGSPPNQTSGVALLLQRIGNVANPQRQTGAMVAVGDGAGAEDHTYNDLISRVGDIEPANDGVATTVDSAATLTIQITKGITIAQSGGITAREIGLYLALRHKFGIGYSFTPPQPGRPILQAYDQITPTPVAQGGVIAPRYTLNFPV